jgi:hypothetical protein
MQLACASWLNAQESPVAASGVLPAACHFPLVKLKEDCLWIIWVDL